MSNHKSRYSDYCDGGDLSTAGNGGEVWYWRNWGCQQQQPHSDPDEIISKNSGRIITNLSPRELSKLYFFHMFLPLTLFDYFIYELTYHVLLFFAYNLVLKTEQYPFNWIFLPLVLDALTTREQFNSIQPSLCNVQIEQLTCLSLLIVQVLLTEIRQFPLTW